MDNIELIIIGVLVAGIIGTIFWEKHSKGKQIEYKSIFPDVYDEWTEKSMQTEKMGRNLGVSSNARMNQIGKTYKRTRVMKMNRDGTKGETIYSSTNGVRDDHYSHGGYMDDAMDHWDHSDPYLNPGTDAVVDEGYHGIDRGLGTIDHDMGTHDTGDPHQF
ncbi:hypothetical protein [Oceanobacillus halotolerans]|uniref:hypothetical protein n=1 Tax=Oceanobacillus halotolerans TaxID=2663380 RepID=UPI0013D975AA|nr:hypothetical protein [Oceanobacillus halotolerans]